MLCHHMRIRQVNVTLHHVQRCVAQDLLQAENVSAINQVIDGKRMPHQVSVKAIDARPNC